MPAFVGQVCITLHAAERAVERHGLSSLDAANRALAAAFTRSLHLPWRHARSMLDRDPAVRRRGRLQYRVHGNWMMVCRGKTVLTTWALELEELVTIMVWLALDAWPADAP